MSATGSPSRDMDPWLSLTGNESYNFLKQLQRILQGATKYQIMKPRIVYIRKELSGIFVLDDCLVGYVVIDDNNKMKVYEKTTPTWVKNLYAFVCEGNPRDEDDAFVCEITEFTPKNASDMLETTHIELHIEYNRPPEYPHP